MKTVKFAGNDYLGLAGEPRLAETMCRAAQEHGVGATSGRSFLGWSEVHEKLEQDLIAFMGAEDACILPACYLGGLVYYKCIAEHCDVVFCDETSHANQFDGMHAAGLEIRTFRHLDAADLRRQLDEYDPGSDGGAVVATDSVYGMSGEVAPLREIADAARSVDAELFIDDAHGVFALGETGRGAWEACGLKPNEATVLGSMSKALGVVGGFFIGRAAICSRFKRGPFAPGSSPLPPPVAATCAAAVELVRTEPERRDRMWAHARRMREILAEYGIGVVSDQTPIVAMELRDESEAAALAEHFESRGLVIRYAKYPSEPRHNLLRSVARACYTEDDLARFADAVAAAPRTGQ
ncbi:MAG: aminotransferase class I/II-fold pyridoxal phosphate-dependent enzyme [Planctomycetota bacterium]